MPQRKLLAALSRSPIGLVGALLAGISLLLIFTLTIIETISGEGHPYLGLLTFLILPMAMFLGLFLMLVGIRRQRKKRAVLEGSGATEPDFPILDFNNRKTRTALLSLVGVGAVGVIVVASITSKSVEYLDSTEFCGTACHVMEPEYTAYQNSPHARVACAECHIGSGTEHFVRAKLTGLRQVIALTFNTYSRPIPTPVHDLRPSRDTCEHCHWPTKYHGNRTRTITSYRSDEANTQTASVLVNYIGGRTLGKSEGSHWHVDPDVTVRYRSDPSRMNVAEVELTLEDGTVRTFRRDDAPEDASVWREMDCVDCHNRPTHIYWPPDYAVDQALMRGVMSTDLPFVKREALRLLQAEYESKDVAVEQIAEGMRQFYRQEYPEIASTRSADVEEAADITSRIYRGFIYPDMNIGWNPYPDNLGHKDFKEGCFRCHSPEMQTETGEAISQDCGLCHAILAWEKLPEEILPLVR